MKNYLRQAFEDGRISLKEYVDRLYPIFVKEYPDTDPSIVEERIQVFVFENAVNS